MCQVFHSRPSCLFEMVPFPSGFSGYITNRQHDRQAASAAVQEPTRTRRGSAWRSCQIPRERYSLAATPTRIGGLAHTFPEIGLAHKYSAEAPLNSRLWRPAPI